MNNLEQEIDPTTDVPCESPKSSSVCTAPLSEAGQQALAYARRGWPVLPLHSVEPHGPCSCPKGMQCGSAGKHPATTHGVKDATTDEDQICQLWREWPDDNVGIATGDGFLVLDVDGKEGSDTLQRLQKENDELPETPVALSGRGVHYYYRVPNGLTISNSAGKLGTGLDIRGEGGYVVAPPSGHANGRQYEWAPKFGLEDLPLAEAPGWLIALLQKSEASVTPVKPTPLPTPLDGLVCQPPVEIPAALEFGKMLEEEARVLAETPPGKQDQNLNDTAFKIGMRVGAHLIDFNEACRTLVEAGMSMKNHPKREPWTKKQVTMKIKHGLTDGVANFRSKWPVELAEVNERHFIVRVGGKTLVGTVKDTAGKPIPIEFSTTTDIARFYAGRKVQVEDANGNVKKIPLGRYWLDHEWQRIYDRVVFEPSGVAAPGTYNLWRGFAVERKPNDWALLRQHIELNVCQGDPVLFKYVIGWMAYCVQRLDKLPGTALVLRGGQGVGKGTFARSFGMLFGDHFFHASLSKHFLGNFNFHLRDKLVVFADEAIWAGDKSAEGALKAMITEPMRAYEAKGVDIEFGPNYTRLIVASNEDWVIPAGPDDRRFCVLDVIRTPELPDKFFSRLWRQLDEGGSSGFLYYLTRYDLSDFDISDVPQTQALLDQKAHTMPFINSWWEGVLEDGKLTPTHEGWEPVSRHELHSSYLNAAKTQNEKFLSKIPAFTAKLKILLPPPGFESKQPSGSTKGPRLRKWHFPPLKECRAFWNEYTKTEHDWPEEF